MSQHNLFTRLLLASLAVLVLSACLGCGSNLSDALHVSMRRSRLDDTTGVLQLTNTTNKAVTGVRLSILNNDTQERKSHFVGSISPQAVSEIGILEASWEFVPNETIEISAAGFQPVTYRTFRTEGGAVGIR